MTKLYCTMLSLTGLLRSDGSALGSLEADSLWFLIALTLPGILWGIKEWIEKHRTYRAPSEESNRRTHKRWNRWKQRVAEKRRVIHELGGKSCTWDEACEIVGVHPEELDALVEEGNLRTTETEHGRLVSAQDLEGLRRELSGS